MLRNLYANGKIPEAMMFGTYTILISEFIYITLQCYLFLLYASKPVRPTFKVAREKREVISVMKVDDTPIIPMNQIYYNFIRPHQALKGKTPAEAAGVGVNGENKWMELLKRSMRS